MDRIEPRRHRSRWAMLLAALLSSLAAPWAEGRVPRTVAVLPFAAPAAAEETLFFAAGVNEEIHAELGRSQDLRLIGRDSVLRYASGNWDLRRVADDLQATHLITGRIQAVGEQVALEVQLIDGGTAATLWSTRLVRPTEDLFKVQQVLIQLLARQMEVELSETGKPPLGAPTTSRRAYEHYLRAVFVQRTALLFDRLGASVRDQRLEEIELLKKAIEFDPDFYQAHCALARACHRLPWQRLDRQNPSYRVGAQALEKAGKLRPAGGEYLLERARYACWEDSDYPRARTDLLAAERLLPNTPDVFALRALVERKLGAWDASDSALARASLLDPNVVGYVRQTALLAEHRRQYERARELRKRVCDRWPGDDFDRALLARVDFYATGETAPLVAVLRPLLQRERVRAEVAGLALLAGRWAGDAALARQACERLPEAGFVSTNLQSFPRAWCVLLLAELEGKVTDALGWAAAEELYALLRERPGDALLHVSLGLVLAGQGRQADAEALAVRAMAQQEKVQDAMDAPDIGTLQAAIWAATGQEVAAVARLGALADRPGFLLHRGLLLRDPWWRTLRGRADFAALLQKFPDPPTEPPKPSP